MSISTLALLALVPALINAQASGSGTTTRYWDCCKPSCAWTGKTPLAAGSNPVTTCDIHDQPLSDYNAASGCSGGSAYTCSNQSPWAVSDTLSYGFAATTIAGGSESSWCCACYELTFTSGAAKGKQMIVQATNTGSDLSSNQFDIAMPGGGVGIFDGCVTEWGVPSADWGAQYGGISNISQCDNFPAALKPGCEWRFNWFGGGDNPTVDFKQVACPAAITAISGCVRANDAINETPTGSSGQSGMVGSKAASSTVAQQSVNTAAAKSTVQSSMTSQAQAASSGSASAGSAAVAQYGQCGGKNWQGSTTCASGFTCKVENDYYSQCL